MCFTRSNFIYDGSKKFFILCWCISIFRIILWLKYKLWHTNYKKHIKDKNYYSFNEETKPFIIFKDLIEKESNISYTNLVDKAMDVFGTDIVEIEEER